MEQAVAVAAHIPRSRYRVSEDCMGQSHGEMNRAPKLMVIGTRSQMTPETRVEPGKMAEQLVNIIEVAQATGEVAIGKGMRGGVNDHIGGRQD